MVLKINKHKLAIVLIVVVGPVLDLLTGYYQMILGVTSVVTPGVIYRGIILTLVFFLLILKLKRNYFRVVVYYFLLVFAMGMGVHAWMSHEVDLLNHIQRFFKIIFPILGFGAIVYLEKELSCGQSEQFLWKVAGLYGLITACVIAILFVVGTGVATYRYGFSFKGFFGSQNSMGFILVASLSSLHYYIHVYKRSQFLLFLAVDGLFLFVALLLGTRAAVLGVAASIIAFHLLALWRPERKIKISWIVFRVLTLIIIVILGLVIYHYWAQQNVDYFFRKFQMMLQGDFRRRVPDGIRQIRQFSIIEHLFGVGDGEFPLTENDLVDVYGKFGLLILGSLLIFFSSYYARVLVAFLRTRSLRAFALLVPLTLYILHAALAGHSLTSAQSNNLLMLMFYLAQQETRPSVSALANRRKDVRPAGFSSESASSIEYE
jgi:O-antigen ligase